MSIVFNKRIFLVVPIFLAFCFLLFSRFIFAQTSSDIIAMRVVANPNHYSISRWYASQKLPGSPQETTVDGYEAIRDGRTVYVAAANVSGSNFFTNIYIISYNQDAEDVTVDIFGRVLSSWKFNANISTNGQCVAADLSLGANCARSTDCSVAGEYCNSEKDSIVRDVRRLADAADMKIFLEDYKKQKGSYPTMESGSYLPNISLSVWPSWQKVLSAKLSLDIPIDPVNRLGLCGGADFNEITCWNSASHQFAGAHVPAGSVNTFPSLTLPAGSLVYQYLVSADGQSYAFHNPLEVLSAPSTGSAMILNHDPQIYLSNVPIGGVGREYSAFIEAFDPDGDSLSWSLDASPTAQWGTWSAAPVLSGAGAPIQKNVYIEGVGTKNVLMHQRMASASVAGAEGLYSFAVIVSDGRGGTATKNFQLNLVKFPPEIFTSNYVFPASTTNPVLAKIIAKSNIANYPLTYTLSPVGLPGGLGGAFDLVGDSYVFSIAGTITPVEIIGSRSFPFTIGIDDASGAHADKAFSLTFTNTAPQITSQSLSVIVGHNDLVTNPLLIKTRDAENNQISATYDFTNNLPSGLSLTRIGDNFQISGIPSANTPTENKYDNVLEISDVFGMESSNSFSIVLKNNPPVVNPATCVASIRTGDSYDCLISASDPDGHSVASYSMSGAPVGSSFDSATGHISGTLLLSGVYNMLLRAIDQFGAESKYKNIPLTVNTFCGDGIYQKRNSEGRGGPDNNGYEDCDIADRVATSPADSGSDRHYACTGVCPVVGECNDTCQFAGGYCGDTIVQDGTGGTNDYGEKCDGLVGVAANPFDSSSSKQYSCLNCAHTGGWCGDGGVQAVFGEKCDMPGAGISIDNQYDCSNSCEWTGGWCGDATIQSGYGEQCEGADLSGNSCHLFGLINGSLACDGGCKFNISGCDQGPCKAMEVCENGLDDDCDGFVDNNCVPVTINIFDTITKDDAFRVIVDGDIVGQTTKGVNETIEINQLSIGTHILEIVFYDSDNTCGTLGVSFSSNAVLETKVCSCTGLPQCDCDIDTILPFGCSLSLWHSVKGNLKVTVP